MITYSENENEDLSQQSNLHRLKYLLIGNIQKKVIVCEYPLSTPSNIIRDAKTLFDKVVHSICNVNEQRNKIRANGGIYYFTGKGGKYFFFLFSEKDYNERIAFNFIDHIFSNEILDLVNEDGTLTDEGQQGLKELFVSYADGSESEGSRSEDRRNSHNIENKRVNTCPEERLKKVGSRKGQEANLNKDDEVCNPVMTHSNLTVKYDSPDDEKRKNLLWRNIKLYSIVTCIGICIILYLIIPFSVPPTPSILGPQIANTTSQNISTTNSTNTNLTTN